MQVLLETRDLGAQSRDESHERGRDYDVYGLDYGCYVDLMATKSAPQGLFEAEDVDGTERYFEVPQDDYRSIRRAVLDLDLFDREHPEVVSGAATGHAHGYATARGEVVSSPPSGSSHPSE